LLQGRGCADPSPAGSRRWSRSPPPLSPWSELFLAQDSRVLLRNLILRESDSKAVTRLHTPTHPPTRGGGGLAAGGGLRRSVARWLASLVPTPPRNWSHFFLTRTLLERNTVPWVSFAPATTHHAAMRATARAKSRPTSPSGGSRGRGGAAPVRRPLALKPRDERYTKSMSLKYEPASEPLHFCEVVVLKSLGLAGRRTAPRVRAIPPRRCPPVCAPLSPPSSTPPST